MNDHWQSTFNHKETDANLRHTWLNTIQGKFVASSAELRPTIEDARQAVDCMQPSACGPDGITIEFYKATRNWSAELFLAVAFAMLDDEETTDEDEDSDEDGKKKEDWWSDDSDEDDRYNVTLTSAGQKPISHSEKKSTIKI